MPSNYEKSELGFEATYDLPHIERALRDLVQGLAFGYPTCCVEEFCLDQIDGRFPGLRRGKVPNGYSDVYVPCSKCCEQMGRTIIP